MESDLNVLLAKLQEERTEMATRALRLNTFIDSDEYDQVDEEHRACLLIQCYGMKMYLDGLTMRIEKVEDEMASTTPSIGGDD